MLNEKEKEEILKEEKEKKDRQRYAQLKKHINNIQHVENGNLVPNDQKEFDAVQQEIEDLERENPGFNFFKS